MLYFCVRTQQRKTPALDEEATEYKAPVVVAAHIAYRTPIELNVCFQRAVRSMPQGDRPDATTVRRVDKHCLRNTDTIQHVVAAANMEFGMWCDEGNAPEEFNLVECVLDTLDMLTDDSLDY